MVTEEIFSPTTFVTAWLSIGYWKTSDFFFWLNIWLYSVRLSRSSLINTSLGESSKLPISSISIQSSSSSTVTFFSEGLLFSMKP